MKKQTIKRLGGIIAAATLLLAGGSADAQMTLQKAVVSNGGGTSSNGTTTLQYTVGQPIVGTASNGSTTATFGFWSQAMQLSSVADFLGAGAITSLSVYPNPVIDKSQIRVELARSGQTEILLYNAKGALVRTLFSDVQSAGSIVIDLDADQLPSGAYVVAVRAPGALAQMPVTITR